MQRRLAIITLVALAAPQQADARLNPFRQMTLAGPRPEIIIIFDTSGSMNENSGGTDTGSDCSGNQAAIDLAGDFMCSGTEDSGADCLIASNASAGAGMPPQCMSSAGMSRMYFAKRALQNVLDEYGDRVNIGFVAFDTSTGDNAYFKYYPITPTACAVDTDCGTSGVCGGLECGTKVAIYLTRLEQKSGGSWTGGAAWSGGPQGFSGPDGTTPYTLLASNNSLYRRPDGSGFAYKRMNWAGLTASADGYEWTYSGSYYWYPQKKGALGAATFLNSGLATTATASEGRYHGPQIVAGGTTYVHYRWSYDDGGIPNGSDAKVWVAPLADDGTASSNAVEAKTAATLNRLNSAFNGGVAAVDYTPLKSALALAGKVLQDRSNGSCADSSIYPGGSCPYSSADPLAACRTRAVVMLTDGEPYPSLTQNPVSTALSVYCQGCVTPGSCESSGADFSSGGNCDLASSNPITVYPVGINISNSTLTDSADYGDNGADDDSRTSGYIVNNEGDLTATVKNMLSSTTATGDFVTSSVSTATSGQTTAEGDLGIVPSTEYPGWRGHLRAYDLTKDPVVMEWDAADILNTIPDAGTDLYKQRFIYTGHPTINSGASLKLLDDSGTLADEADIRKIWKAMGHPSYPDSLTAAEIQDFFRWLYGHGRTHRLGPIVRCTPAIVGAPPGLAFTGHSAFAGTAGAREDLIYVTDNDGMVHAFRAAMAADGGGEEVFAVVPPGSLSLAYELYKQGGQAATASAFKWILANSPRVQDLYDGGGWQTLMILPHGPYVHGLTVLDISNPTDCSVAPCVAADPPVYVVAAFLGDETGGTMGNHYGEGWSVPSAYFTLKSGLDVYSHVSAGSGYGSATSSDKYETAVTGHHYMRFGGGKALWSNWAEYLHDPTAVAQLVDAAVLADTPAALNENGLAVATYQADLEGRMLRYPLGEPKAPDELLAANAVRPFYYAPAVMYIEADEVVVAANSDSADEEDPSASTEAHLMMFSETSGATTSYFDCKVNNLSGCVDLDTSSFSGTYPSASAKPVCQPLLVLNDPGTGTKRPEAFFLLYAPSTASVTSCSSGGGGTSYLVRISYDATAGTSTLEEVDPISGRASGMTLAGGGTKVVVGRSGSGSGQADVGLPQGEVSADAASARPPKLEFWREVK